MYKPLTRAEVAKFAKKSGAMDSMHRVPEELYTTRPPSEESLKTRENLAYKYSSDTVPPNAQYYLQETQKPATVVHICDSSYGWREDDCPMDEGSFVYTRGFLWTNTNPNWEWKTQEDEPDVRYIRVRVDLPTGTQVVVDRAPVYGGADCEFDASGNPPRLSLFPDVLLPPGKFEIVSVKRYQKGDESELTLLKDARTRVVTDDEYAAYVTTYRKEFIDIALRATDQMVQLPAPDNPDKAGGPSVK
jgi:hypothetical protein